MSLFLHVTLVNWRDVKASPGRLTGLRKGKRVKGCETTQNKGAETPVGGHLPETDQKNLKVGNEMTIIGFERL